jgi:hypothetical protein
MADEFDSLQDMLTWVHDHSAVPEIGMFLVRLGENHGKTLDQLAEEKPGEALELCEALFWMVEDEYSPEQLHAYFKKHQPERRYDPEFRMPQT